MGQQIAAGGWDEEQDDRRQTWDAEESDDEAAREAADGVKKSKRKEKHVKDQLDQEILDDERFADIIGKLRYGVNAADPKTGTVGKRRSIRYRTPKRFGLTWQPCR
jgi:hypothetical protein